MRVPAKARALLVGTVALGAGAIALGVLKTATAIPFATLALFGAAVVVTELIQVSTDDLAFEPLDGQIFTFSSAVHLAAVVVVGPWGAALVAAFGVVVVDGLRGQPWSRVSFNASVFALSACAGGFAFRALAGSPGSLSLPHDFPALAALTLVYSLLNAVLVNAISALGSPNAQPPKARDLVHADLSSRAAEAGLGIGLALAALTQPWALVAFVPLVLTVYQAHARLIAQRSETARALETFANVVDERDTYTFEHSARVAEYVRALAAGVGLPAREVARLRWAGRLHDLGKIAVDAGVLRKPGRLDEDEWEAMRRHPRLSARLLRRFHFAADAARAVEYHHERFDGGGYYGIDPARLPLAAHFIIVADSFDAMTTDRPYRSGFSREHALAEIERNTGSQYHPAVAKAFVAAQRGLDPVAALSPQELDELRRLSVDERERRGARELLRRIDGERLVLAGIAGSLLALGFGERLLALSALLAAPAGILWRHLELNRAHRIAASLRAPLQPGRTRTAVFDELVGRVAATADLGWAGVVSWRERDLGGWVELERRLGGLAPTETALTSWLIRDAEVGRELLLADGAELGTIGSYVAIPHRREGTLHGFLVLGFTRPLPRALEAALRQCAEELAAGVAGRLRDASDLPRPIAAAL